MAKIIFEKNLEIPMRDGCVLRADLFRPDTSDKLPVIINRTPYNKSMPMVFALTMDALRAASAVYNVLIQDCRGRFASGGVFNCFTDEARDVLRQRRMGGASTMVQRQHRHVRRVVHGRDTMARGDAGAAVEYLGHSNIDPDKSAHVLELIEWEREQIKSVRVFHF
jgi:hypothetical protein